MIIYSVSVLYMLSKNLSVLYSNIMLIVLCGLVRLKHY